MKTKKTVVLEAPRQHAHARIEAVNNSVSTKRVGDVLELTLLDSRGAPRKLVSIPRTGSESLDATRERIAAGRYSRGSYLETGLNLLADEAERPEWRGDDLPALNLQIGRPHDWPVMVASAAGGTTRLLESAKEEAP